MYYLTHPDGLENLTPRQFGTVLLEALRHKLDRLARHDATFREMVNRDRERAIQCLRLLASISPDQATQLLRETGLL